MKLEIDLDDNKGIIMGLHVKNKLWPFFETDAPQRKVNSLKISCQDPEEAVIVYIFHTCKIIR